MAYLESLIEFFFTSLHKDWSSMAPLVIFCLLKNIKRRDRLPSPVFLGFPCGSAGKESTCNAGDLGSIPGLGRSSGEGKGPLKYSGLENSMDRGPWRAIVHGVAKSQT